MGRRTHKGMRCRSDLPRGNVPWQGGACAGGWRRNGQKARCVNQGDLPTQEPNGWWLGRHPSTTATERAGVRAPIVATKGRNGPGAKGAQEGGDVTDRAQEDAPATVSARTQQAGEAQNPWAIRARWAWVEPEVWTERMLTARLIPWPVNPLGGKTTHWRAGCGRTACPVRREGARPIPLSLPLSKARLRRAVRANIDNSLSISWR